MAHLEHLAGQVALVPGVRQTLRKDYQLYICIILCRMMNNTVIQELEMQHMVYYKYVLVWRNTDAGYYRNWCNCIGCYYCLHLYLQR